MLHHGAGEAGQHGVARGGAHRPGSVGFLELEVAGVVVRSVRLVGQRAGQPLDEFQQLVVFDDDRIDRCLRPELDAVDRLQVGRVRQQHGQPVASLGNRQDEGLGQQLRVDQVRRDRGRVERCEVHQRQAEGVGREAGEPGCRHRAAGHHLVDEFGVGGVGLLLDRDGLLELQQVVLDECAREPGKQDAVGGGGGHAHARALEGGRIITRVSVACGRVAGNGGEAERGRTAALGVQAAAGASVGRDALSAEGLRNTRASRRTSRRLRTAAAPAGRARRRERSRPRCWHELARRAVDRDRRHDRVAQPQEHACGEVVTGRALLEQHDDGLVAAEAPEHVLVAQHGAQPVRRLLQHAVAGRVAVPVVDRLEAVEVDEHHVHAQAVLRSVLEHLVRRRLGRGADRQAGLPVSVREVAQPLLPAVRLADVARDAVPHALRAGPRRERVAAERDVALADTTEHAGHADSVGERPARLEERVQGVPPAGHRDGRRQLPRRAAEQQSLQVIALRPAAGAAHEARRARPRATPRSRGRGRRCAAAMRARGRSSCCRCCRYGRGGRGGGDKGTRGVVSFWAVGRGFAAGAGGCWVGRSGPTQRPRASPCYTRRLGRRRQTE